MAIPPQTPDSLTELTRLMGGDLSGSLSGGDKLLALSGLLRSATRSGRRAGLTPDQVIGGLQQQKMSELQNRMAVEQMRAQQAQAQQARAIRQQIRETLPEDQRQRFDFLPDAEVIKLMGKQLENQLVPGEDKMSSMARQITEATGFPVGSPQHSQLMQQYLSQPQTMMTPSGLVSIPGLSFGETPQQAQPRILTQRPPGLTDDQLFEQARKAVENGADVNLIFQQLKAWGVQT